MMPLPSLVTDIAVGEQNSLVEARRICSNVQKKISKYFQMYSVFSKKKVFTKFISLFLIGSVRGLLKMVFTKNYSQFKKLQ